MKHRAALATFATAFVLQSSGVAWAQTVNLDEGTFRILIGGREVGLETFSIAQNGTGADAVIIARGRVAVEAGDGSEVEARVQLTGADLRPVAYELEIQGSEARRIRGSVTGSRASSRTVSSAGESMKEYLVTDGAVVVDANVAHHYHFVAARALSGATRLALMVPRESRQIQATVSVAGADEVSAGGRTVSARKIVVSLSGGDVRNVWVDAQGRVLRVEIPSRNYVAVRTSLP